MPFPLVAMLMTDKMMLTPEGRPTDTPASTVEAAECPWMLGPRPGQRRAAEPTVWIEDILDDLDGLD